MLEFYKQQPLNWVKCIQHELSKLPCSKRWKSKGQTNVRCMVKPKVEGLLK